MLAAGVDELFSGIIELLSYCVELVVINTNLGSKITVQHFEKRFIEVDAEDQQSFGAESVFEIPSDCVAFLTWEFVIVLKGSRRDGSRGRGMRLNPKLSVILSLLCKDKP